MKVHTKKYQLEKRTYLKLALLNILRQQWWIIPFAVLGTGILTYFVRSAWWSIPTLVGLTLYCGFWFVQFYAVTQLAQTQFIFEKVSYELSSQHLVIQLDSKHGIPLEWNQIKRGYSQREGFLLEISKAHLIYLPHKILQSAHEIKFIETLLRRKNLLHPSWPFPRKTSK